MAVRGYHRTSLDDVLRESGAGKGNFYHYFRSKEDLGYAILDRLLERFEARTLTPIFGDDTRDPWVRSRRSSTRSSRRSVPATAWAGAPWGTSPPSSPTRTKASDSAWPTGSSAGGSALRRPSTRARARATLAPDVDAEVVARFLVAGIEGAILLTKVQKDIGVMEHCVGELRRHLALYRRSEGVVPAGAAR